jgi:hypothetical protein
VDTRPACGSRRGLAVAADRPRAVEDEGALSAYAMCLPESIPIRFEHRFCYSWKRRAISMWPFSKERPREQLLTGHTYRNDALFAVPLSSGRTGPSCGRAEGDTGMVASAPRVDMGPGLPATACRKCRTATSHDELPVCPALQIVGEAGCSILVRREAAPTSVSALYAEAVGCAHAGNAPCSNSSCQSKKAKAALSIPRQRSRDYAERDDSATEKNQRICARFCGCVSQKIAHIHPCMTFHARAIVETM